jgi:DNA 3'-phosphatase
MYKSIDFQYNPSIIICEFENCLISRITAGKLYHAINPKTITPHNEEFIKRLKNDTQDASLVIISNQLVANKLNMDMIKRKLEGFIEMYKFPLLALFAMRPNRLSKPHTGMWQLLQSYYKSVGGTIIQKACVVSNYGGRIVEETGSRGTSKISYDISDMDRAFAENIDVPYFTITEYMYPEKKEKFIWNKGNLPPEIRELYIEKLSEYKNPNIFAKMAEFGQVEAYMIMIFGAPRSGKTTLAREIIKKWRNSEFGKQNEIKRVGKDRFTRARMCKEIDKLLGSRISVIVDGDCHTVALRQPYLEIAKKYSIPVTYIEVNPGIGMAYLFNHVAVEQAKTEDIELYSERDYLIYKGTLQQPAETILYCPYIKKSKELMEYRF